MKRAVIYLRVSTAKQANKDIDPEGYSIPAQREACYRKAESLGAEVADEYTDRGESARSADRPALLAMLERVRENRDIDYVIVHKVDRLARSREDDVSIGLALREAGAQLVSVSENIDETPSGKLLHGIMATIAEFYSRNLATEITKGMSQKAKKGGTPTLAPIGYLNVREWVDGREIRTVVPDPERAPHVRWAFEAYATGDYTYRTLLTALAARGLRTRPTKVHEGKPLSMSRLGALLHNRYYAGFVTYRGVEYEGRHEPLVDLETFARVQDVLKAHDHASERQRIHNHYLKGSVFCGRCGSRLCLSHAKGRYLYFFCLGRANRKNGCPQPYVLADDIEEAVCRMYRTIQLDENQVEGITRRLVDAFEKRSRASMKEAERQEKRLIRLRDERQKLLRAHYGGAIPLDLLRSEQQRITTEVEQAEATLGRSAIKSRELEETLRDALDVVANAEEAYRRASTKIRRQFNQTFFERLLVEDNRLSGAELTAPFAHLLADGLAKKFRRETANPGLLFHGQGSNKDQMVELPGIEPGWERRSRARVRWLRARRGRSTERSVVELPGIEPGSSDPVAGLLRA